ncbi:hypothetical protein BDZ89DRAFT_1055173 [Hymenopellis radicata]|nr:hypothetical protein BDZ89DRAFT_1055173 [Hymenopellis radicata]
MIEDDKYQMIFPPGFALLENEWDEGGYEASEVIKMCSYAANDDDDNEDEIEKELLARLKARTSVAAVKTEALQNFHKSGSGSSSFKKAGCLLKDEVKLGAVFITTCGTINAVVRESWSIEAVDQYLRKLFRDTFTYFDLRASKTHRGSLGQSFGLTRLRLEEGKELEDSDVEKGTKSLHDIAETSKAARSKTRTASKRRRGRSTSVHSESERSDRVTRSSAAKQKIKQESEPSTSTETVDSKTQTEEEEKTMHIMHQQLILIYQRDIFNKGSDQLRLFLHIRVEVSIKESESKHFSHRQRWDTFVVLLALTPFCYFFFLPVPLTGPMSSDPFRLSTGNSFSRTTTVKMPPLPSPAQVGLREPPHPWGTVYKNLLKNLFDRGWPASYDHDKADLIGLPRPVKIHENYSASEIGADRLNDFLPYDIFCVHAAVPTNDLEKCCIKVHFNRQVNGIVVDALSPSTHSCAYTIVIKNAMRKSFPDLFLDKKLIIPVINYTNPLVVHCLENPYRALLGVPRANPGFDYQNEFQVPPPPAIPQPVPAPPVYRPPRAALSAPPHTAPSAPPRAAPSAPPRATPSASSHASPSAPPRAAPGPSSSRTDTMSSAQKISQKRKSNNELDDEVEVIWQGHVEPRGNKPMPIDVDSYPSPPQRCRQRSPAISDSRPSSQAQKNSKIISVILLGNRANDLDMLSAKQVAAGKAIDHALIKATEALFDLDHYNSSFIGYTSPHNLLNLNRVSKISFWTPKYSPRLSGPVPHH